MFLNLSPPAPPNNGGTVFDQCPPGSMMVDGVCVGDPSTYGPRILIDQDVNYYGFLKSTEYNNWMKSIEGQMLTMDVYDSPYFGFQGSGAYAGLDRLYEAYKSNLPIDITQPDPNVKRVTSTTSTINPLLILAAAAFFIGG
jgi:hypothetical protein